MLKKNVPERNVQVSPLFQVNSSEKNQKGMCKKELLQNSHSSLEKILHKYETVFQDDLPKGVPPGRAVDHAIEVEKDAKPPHRPLFQLSPAEFEAAKNYREDLLRNGKIRPSKSSYGAPLFFVKYKDKPLRGVVDYRALNRITKRNSAPLPRSDEMPGVFQAGSQDWISSNSISNRKHREDCFTTKYGQF